MTEIRRYDEVSSASWGAVAGGAVTVLAVSILLSLLTFALGFGMVDAQSEDPLSGVGTAFGFGSALAVILSLAAGGFVAGRLAGRTGFTHGFLTWAVALILASVVSASAISGAVRVTASAVGSTAGTVASAVGAAGEAGANAAVSLVETIDEEIIGTVDFQDVQRRVRAALRNSEVEALQPENLEAEFEGARGDIRRALHDLRFNPGEFGRVAEELAASLRERAQTVAADIDREDAVTALTNAGLTRPEAEQATDRAIEAFEDARGNVETRIAQAEERVEQARQRLAELEEGARRQADAAAAAASSGALWAFFAGLVGAAVSGFAGLAGARTRDRYPFA